MEKLKDFDRLPKAHQKDRLYSVSTIEKRPPLFFLLSERFQQEGIIIKATIRGMEGCKGRLEQGAIRLYFKEKAKKTLPSLHNLFLFQSLILPAATFDGGPSCRLQVLRCTDILRIIHEFLGIPTGGKLKYHKAIAPLVKCLFDNRIWKYEEEEHKEQQKGRQDGEEDQQEENRERESWLQPRTLQGSPVANAPEPMILSSQVPAALVVEPIIAATEVAAIPLASSVDNVPVLAQVIATFRRSNSQRTRSSRFQRWRK